ncbi:MinD/ParA family ATP-binding protein [Paeniglutamicibacter sp. R2-26]|uniref:MinD/ParA family ATP-binding protein n=1 Tax=Paeniglutamicibacter sp. R2-26 TaxID=3144417 RepID=UPI003EE572F8
MAPVPAAIKKGAPTAKSGASTSEPKPAKNAKKAGKATADFTKPAKKAEQKASEGAGPATTKVPVVGDSPKAGATKPGPTAVSEAKAAIVSAPAAAGKPGEPGQAMAAPAPSAAAETAPVDAEAGAAASASGETGPATREDLSTADGRRQAFRDMTPGAGERDTFLRPEDETSFRAERGFRGFLSRMGFNMEPSAQEVEERNWRRAVGTRLNEPKTISVVNGKGGANKTPTAVLLSAVFGRNGGDPVLVWDNNGTRGTLGWRTVQNSHSRHSMDLLGEAGKLKDVKVGDPVIHDYVHYQPEDCYSVLRTDPTLLASEQHVNAADFDVLHEIVSRFFALTIVDSGNDESAERWMRMIDHTDQLVIASTTVEEHAEAGALLLEALAKRGGHYAELAKNAVVIVSQHQPQGNNDQLNRITHGFRRLARSVVTVPYDAALVKGQIRFDELRPATRRSWLHATAAVADALTD